MSRPHWLPEDAWMGVVIGEWPLYAFTSKDQAARWACESDRRRVWPVTIPADVPVSKGVVVPSTHKLVGVSA